MGLRENIQTDLRSRNLTIYAQWTSTCAAISLYLIGIPLLVTYLIQLSSVVTVSKWVLLEPLIHALIFPLAPLALAIPHYVPRTPYLYLAMLAWIDFTTRLIYTNFTNFKNTAVSDVSGLMSVGSAKMFLVLFITVIASTSIVTARLVTHSAQSSSGAKIRVAVNILCCVHLAVGWSKSSSLGIGHYVRSSYLGVVGVFGVAALLCVAATVRRHEWVYSVTLGKTSVENGDDSISEGLPKSVCEK